MFMFCGLLILFTDSFGRKYLIKTEGISFVSFVYFHWYHIKDETENMDVDTDTEGMELKINLALAILAPATIITIFD